MSENSSGETFAALVRSVDPTRYFSNQFAPLEKREDLFVLYSLDLEIRKISQTIREPMAGEIRLQWWREVFHGERDDEAHANPMANAALALVRKHRFDPAVLDRHLDGRLFDLYSDPIEDAAAFEAYAGQTDGTILQLACLILDREQSSKAAELSGYLSCVSSLWTRVLRPLNSNIQDHVFRYLPPDLLAEAGHNANPFLEEESQNTDKVVSKACEFANTYLAKARDCAPSVPATLHPAFLHLSQVSASLEAITKSVTSDKNVPDPSTFRLIWRLWRASKSWPCF